MRWLASPLLLAALLLTACARPPELVAVPAPDLATQEPPVRELVSAAWQQVERARGGGDSQQLAAAYGELALACHAQLLLPCAEVAYRNAAALAPAEVRWPYLLGHLQNDDARPQDAVVAFERALAADGKDAPTLYSLAELLLKRGGLDRSARLFTQLQQQPAARAAALAGLGRVATARRQSAQAAGFLEEALRLEPQATQVRYQLAMAYRAAGEPAKAAALMASYAPSGMELAPPDPHVEALSAHVRSSMALARKGVRLARAGQFEAAVQAYEAARQSRPQDADLLANLGVALANLGKLPQATEMLRSAVRLNDKHAPAHLSLAVVLDRQGQDAAAASEYEATLRLDPANAQATLYLADAHMRAGRAERAAALYRKALELAPSTRTRMSLALALMHQSADGEAKAVLEQGLAQEPQHQPMANALARLLACASNPKVRDGPKALQLAQALLQRTASAEVGQTYAMALAATGQFDRAVQVQEQVAAAFTPESSAARRSFVDANLQRYRAHRAAVQPWPAADPIFQPRSPLVARTNGPA